MKCLIGVNRVQRDSNPNNAESSGQDSENEMARIGSFKGTTYGVMCVIQGL